MRDEETPAVCECGHAKSLHQRDAKFCCASFGEQDCPCMSYRPAAPSPDRTEREPTPMTEERLAEIHGWFDENTTICWRTNVAELLAEMDRLRAAPTGEPSADLAGLVDALANTVAAFYEKRATFAEIINARANVDRALAGLQARPAEAERDAERWRYFRQFLSVEQDLEAFGQYLFFDDGRISDETFAEGFENTIESLVDQRRAALRPTASPAREPEPTTTETSDAE